ncbi:hypothetical protein D3C72_2210180 [compost metagenome]
MSLAILNRAAAAALIAPWEKTMESCDASASNLFGAVTKGRPVILEISSATFSAKPIGALRPVPTAVPPWASLDSAGRVSSILAMAEATCAA